MSTEEFTAITFCYLGPWIAVPPGDSNLMSVWQVWLPATHRLFILLTRGSTFKLFLLRESVLRFQYTSLPVQKDRKWRGKGDVAGRLRCLSWLFVLQCAGCEVLFAVLSDGTRALVGPAGGHRLVLPMVSAGNKPSRHTDSLSLGLVLCSCGCLGFFQLTGQKEQALATCIMQYKHTGEYTARGWVVTQR